MPISAEFSVEGSSAVQEHVVAYGATVDFVLLSLGSANSISWSIIGTSKSTQAALTITPAGAPSGTTASCVMPSDPGDGLGRSFVVKCTVSDGTNTATAYRVFGALNSAGKLPVAANEQNYRNATHGYVDVFNAALNAVGGAAGGTTQLLYNNAGVIDGASGITIIDSETGLKATHFDGSGTVAANGVVRGANNVGIAVGRKAAGGDVLLGYISDANAMFFGRPTGPFVEPADAAFYVATSGTFFFRVNGDSGNELSISATTIDCFDNTLANVGDFDHDGANVGFYGTTPIAKQTGVAVSAAGVHAALVNLGLIAA